MPERGYDMIVLALASEDPQHDIHESRYAVHRRLHDRPQDLSLLRLRPHAAGDRALGQNHKRRAARADEGAAEAHARGRAAADVGGQEARLIHLSDILAVPPRTRFNL